MNTLINVVIPVFAIIGAGFLAGRFKLLGTESAHALNRFVYFFALPPVLFVFPARQPIAEVLNWPFINAFLAGAVVTALIALIVSRFWIRHDGASLSLHTLCAVYPNTSYMGVPLFITAYGIEGTMPAIVATLVVVVVMVGGVFAALEAVRAESANPFRILVEVTSVLARNPLLIAVILGITWSFLNLPIPKPAENFLDLMASAAGPCALFALGLSLVGRRLLGDMAEITWVLILKMLAQPAITWVFAFHVFPMDPVWASSVVLLAGLPVGAVAFVIAQQYNCYLQRTSSAIVLSTAVSVFTLSTIMILLDIG